MSHDFDTAIVLDSLTIWILHIIVLIIHIFYLAMVLFLSLSLYY